MDAVRCSFTHHLRAFGLPLTLALPVCLCLAVIHEDEREDVPLAAKKRRVGGPKSGSKDMVRACLTIGTLSASLCFVRAGALARCSDFT